MAKVQVAVGQYFLRRKEPNAVRKVEAVLPDGVKLRVRHYWTASNLRMWDLTDGAKLAKWGRLVDEAEARRLVANMDELDRELDAERVPFIEEVDLGALAVAVLYVNDWTRRVFDALPALLRATENSQSPAIVQARALVLAVLAENPHWGDPRGR